MHRARRRGRSAQRPSGSAGRCRGRPTRTRGASRTRSHEQLDKERRPLERRRLIGDADFERAEARIRADVPPDARMVLDHAERDQPLDPGFPRVVPREDRRRAARGSSTRMPARFDSMPVASPLTNGEFTESASTPEATAARPRAAPSTARRRHPDMHVQPVDTLPPRGAPDARHASRRYRSSSTSGSASRCAVGWAPAAAMARPFAAAIRAAAAAAPRARRQLPRRSAQTPVASSTTDAWSSVFERARKREPSAPRSSVADPGDRARASPRRGSSPPPRRRASAAVAAKAALDHVLPRMPCTRAAGGLPRVVRRARAERRART